MNILIAGCGDLGLALAELLLSDVNPDQEALQNVRHNIYGLRRNTEGLPKGIMPVAADVSKAETLHPLSTLAPQVLVYTVAASSHDDAGYQAAYVDGLRNVLQSLQQNPPQHIFFVSSTGVYGQETDTLLDETTAPEPRAFTGLRMLEAEQVLQAQSIPHTILRLSGIYGPGRTRMLRLAQTGQWPSSNAWSNRIHRDDAAAFIHFLIARLLAGDSLATCYIVTDDHPVSQYEVLAWIANQLGAALPPTNPELAAVQGGKRLSNARMKSTGFVLRYPDYRAGYAALIAQMQAS